MAEKLYEITSSFYRLNRIPIVVHQPKEKTETSKIAILTMHNADYLDFAPIVELAKRGFTTAGAIPWRKTIDGWMGDIKTCVEFLREYPGVEKLVLMGHSQGGCYMSCYQYIAENGIERFKKTDRIIPFPDIEPLPAGDGLMLLDSNYGIMRILALDPGVRLWDNGFARIPELDIFNPDNGYVPGASHYSEEFIRRFQKAQIEFYRDILDYCQDRWEKIRKGRGRFEDDEPIMIAGGHSGSFNNKLFIEDPRLLGRTSRPEPLLHADGTVTCDDIVHTVRTPKDTIRSKIYKRGPLETSVKDILETEIRFDDDFGYDECSMWGVDGNFNYMSTRENVKYIHVPLLISGNTGSHEFVNAEFNYDSAVSADKDLIMVEGAKHMFEPFAPQYGDTCGNAADYFATWLSKPGRFL